jgi:hypothetical protein
VNEALCHHTSIESGGEEPCRERRIPVREGVSDQRMSLCRERADLGRRSVERRCFAEAGFRRKPCRKPVCTPRGSGAASLRRPVPIDRVRRWRL